MKLLLVEDDSFFAQRITEYLTDNGVATETVRTTGDALRVCIDEYDGAVIDVMLPNQPEISGIPEAEARGGFFSGVALARRFRKTKSSFPLILLSSDIAGGEARRWAKENGVPFVFKHEERSRLLSRSRGSTSHNARSAPSGFYSSRTRPKHGGGIEGLLAEHSALAGAYCPQGATQLRQNDH